MNRQQRESARASFSTDSTTTSRLCPDPKVCPQCPQSKTCMYLRFQNRLAILERMSAALEERLTNHPRYLITIRRFSRHLTGKLGLDLSEAPEIGRIVNNALVEVRATEWGNACSEYRLEKWNVRPVGSKIYGIDGVVVESLKWYVERYRQSRGGSA